MTFWQFLDRRWPHERGWVTIATYVLAAAMLKMAEVHRDLWNVELFKTLLTLVIGTAIVNMILAFHFTANKADEHRVEHAAKLAEAGKAEEPREPESANCSGGPATACDDPR